MTIAKYNRQITKTQMIILCTDSTKAITLFSSSHHEHFIEDKQ